LHERFRERNLWTFDDAFGCITDNAQNPIALPNLRGIYMIPDINYIGTTTNWGLLPQIPAQLDYIY